MITSNINNIKKLKKKHIEIFSFDVFDTLLIRNIDPPEAIKKIIASKIDQNQIFDLTSEEIYTLRIQCETSIKNKKIIRGFDSECSIAEIYIEMLKKSRKPFGCLDTLIDIELSVESAFSAPMPHMEALLKKLHMTHRIIAVSDTYLPADMICNLLSNAGLKKYIDKIYSSCDHYLNKASGRLFGYIQKNEKIPFNRWVHVGDNYISDFFRAKVWGIQPVLFYNHWNIKRRSNLYWSLKLIEKKQYQISRSITSLSSIHPYQSLNLSCGWRYNILVHRALSNIIFYVLHVLKFFPPHLNIIFIERLIKLTRSFNVLKSRNLR